MSRAANNVDQQYLDLFRYILKHGVDKDDRTGVGTKSIFGYQMRFDMGHGFPLLTSKHMYTKGILVELLWFLGKHCEQEPYRYLQRTNIKYLVDNDCNIWVGDAYKRYKQECCEPGTTKTEYWMRSNPDRTFSCYTQKEFIEQIKTNLVFAKQWGDLGPIYGKQWRMWEDCELAHPIDQIANLIHDLKENPDSRRLMVSAWNVDELHEMVLPPCHYGFQCYTRKLTFDERISHLLSQDGWRDRWKEVEGSTTEKLDELNMPTRELSLMWNQRSVDTPLGLPYNIASYGFLLHMLSDMCNMVPGELIANLGDTHIYNNQLSGVETQLANPTYELPTLRIKPGKRKDISEYNIEDFEILDYQHAGVVKYPLSN